MGREHHILTSLVRGLLPGTLAALLLVILAACNNNPYPAGETAQAIIYSTIGDDPKTLDPSIAYDVASSSIIDNIYPSYMQYNYLKRDPFVVEPGLGAEEPKRERVAVTITEDGQTITKQGERWTFRIKKGLYFQDDPCFLDGKGREILAADFLYTFRRLADPAVPSPIIQYIDDKVLGMAAYKAHNAALLKQQKPSDYTFPMRGLETDPDPYTFHITLSQPYPQLRYLMAMHFTTPLAHEAVERYGKDLARHPVGSGAFVLAEYTPKSRIVLVKNPNFRADYYPSEGAPGDREAGLLEAAGQRLPLSRENSDQYRAREHHELEPVFAGLSGFCWGLAGEFSAGHGPSRATLARHGAAGYPPASRCRSWTSTTSRSIWMTRHSAASRNPTANCDRPSRWPSTPRLS